MAGLTTWRTAPRLGLGAVLVYAEKEDFGEKKCLVYKNYTRGIFQDLLSIIARFFEEKHEKPPFTQLFLNFFQEIFSAWKRVYRMLSFPTAPSVSHKKTKKLAKKVLTGCAGRGIIYKSSRYGNKTKAKIVRHEPWKLNINLEKSECAGRARKRKTKSNNFFFK